MHWTTKVVRTWGVSPLEYYEDWGWGGIESIDSTIAVDRLFEGMYGGEVLAVDGAGTLLNEGHIGMFGIYLPTISNVVAADLNEFGGVFLTDDGEVLSIGSEGMPEWDPQIPYDVWYSQTVDVASTYEVHIL